MADNTNHLAFRYLYYIKWWMHIFVKTRYYNWVKTRHQVSKLVFVIELWTSRVTCICFNPCNFSLIWYLATKCFLLTKAYLKDTVGFLGWLRVEYDALFQSAGCASWPGAWISTTTKHNEARTMRITQCGAVITRSIFFGVSFVCSNSYLYFALVTAMMCVISCYIKPR